MEHVPVPEPGPNDVLIRVKKSAICGNRCPYLELDAWAAKTIPVGMVVGHEFSGEIADIGSAVTRYRVASGFRRRPHRLRQVPQLPRRPRHLCRNTLGRRRQPPRLLRRISLHSEAMSWPFPKDVPTRSPPSSIPSAMPFTPRCPLIWSRGRAGDRAGPIGIMGAMVAKRAGARKVVITDVNPVRLELARKPAIDHVVNAATDNLVDVMRQIGMTEGFDVGLEMSGAPPAFRR